MHSGILVYRFPRIGNECGAECRSMFRVRRGKKEKGDTYDTLRIYATHGPTDAMVDRWGALRGRLRTLRCYISVARWQNFDPPRPPPWRNPKKGRDQILQRSVAEP